MAHSSDGFVARGPEDDMSWTGSADKALFRLLTRAGSQVCGVGSNTYKLMPKLPGRKLTQISRGPDGISLEDLWRIPNSWLLGGQTLALEALDLGCIETAFMVEVPLKLKKGIKDRITSALLMTPYRVVDWVRIDELIVRVWS